MDHRLEMALIYASKVQNGLEEAMAVVIFDAGPAAYRIAVGQAAHFAQRLRACLDEMDRAREEDE